MTDLLIHRKQRDSALESDDPTPLDPIRTRIQRNMHPWDLAHEVFNESHKSDIKATPFEAASEHEEILFVEPDFVQNFTYRLREPASALESFESAELCEPRNFDLDWPHGEFGWHLQDSFSQLKSARDSLGDPGNGNRIRVGILDTGYDPRHTSLPENVNLELARNFSGSGDENDAVDPSSSWPMTNPGHGTATMALLAGSKVRSVDGSFTDYLGGAPYVEVVPIRIADSVVHFRTSSMAQGIRYAANIGCQVLSISMGGVPTRAWADAVNYAYDRGVCIFAAAGNRIGVSPPSTLVYPARFNRVVGVCGFMHDKTPYFKDGFHSKMQGCFGPESVMGNAMAAFTPNIPWAAMGCEELVDPDGAGTSSATPQCAAAAALWLQKHRPETGSMLWQRVESVRHALFSTADSTVSSTYFRGNGLLRASAALEIPFDSSSLRESSRDTLSFPWLRLLGALEADSDLASIHAMLEAEALQVYLRSPKLQRIAENADPTRDTLGEATRKELLKVMSELNSVSNSLRRQLNELAR